jgi:hypothetical protein
MADDQQVRLHGLVEVFEGTVDEARLKARLIIAEGSRGELVRCVEGWCQLANGRIQFRICTLRMNRVQ